MPTSEVLQPRRRMGRVAECVAARRRRVLTGDMSRRTGRAGTNDAATGRPDQHRGVGPVGVKPPHTSKRCRAGSRRRTSPLQTTRHSGRWTAIGRRWAVATPLCASFRHRASARSSLLWQHPAHFSGCCAHAVRRPSVRAPPPSRARPTTRSEAAAKPFRRLQPWSLTR
eukprot:350354-Chlamydomonas_euryale.AAC.4